MALVLIIDDEPSFRMLLEAAVQEMGHTVITAVNGVKGLEEAKAQQPHLIVSDIMMPEMDGVELNAFLQLDPRTKDIPVLMLTGSMDKHMEVSVNYASSLNFEFIIGKNAPLEQITGTIKEIILKYYNI